MEDYERAYKNRLLDIDALLAANVPRITAATHLGGVAIECRLKALVITYHSIKEWASLVSELATLVSVCLSVEPRMALSLL